MSAAHPSLVVIKRSGNDGQRYVLDGRYWCTIGSHQECDIVIHSAGVAKLHALVRVTPVDEDGRLQASLFGLDTDLPVSLPATGAFLFVDEGTHLNDGDIFHVGERSFRFEFAARPANVRPLSALSDATSVRQNFQPTSQSQPDAAAHSPASQRDVKLRRTSLVVRDELEVFKPAASTQTLMTVRRVSLPAETVHSEFFSKSTSSPKAASKQKKSKTKSEANTETPRTRPQLSARPSALPRPATSVRKARPAFRSMPQPPSVKGILRTASYHNNPPSPGDSTPPVLSPIRPASPPVTEQRSQQERLQTPRRLHRDELSQRRIDHDRLTTPRRNAVNNDNTEHQVERHTGRELSVASKHRISTPKRVLQPGASNTPRPHRDEISGLSMKTNQPQIHGDPKIGTPRRLAGLSTSVLGTETVPSSKTPRTFNRLSSPQRVRAPKPLVDVDMLASGDPHSSDPNHSTPSPRRDRDDLCVEADEEIRSVVNKRIANASPLFDKGPKRARTGVRPSKSLKTRSRELAASQQLSFTTPRRRRSTSVSQSEAREENSEDVPKFQQRKPDEEQHPERRVTPAGEERQQFRVSSPKPSGDAIVSTDHCLTPRALGLEECGDERSPVKRRMFSSGTLNEPNTDRTPRRKFPMPSPDKVVYEPAPQASPYRQRTPSPQSFPVRAKERPPSLEFTHASDSSDSDDTPRNKGDLLFAGVTPAVVQVRRSLPNERAMPLTESRVAAIRRREKTPEKQVRRASFSHSRQPQSIKLRTALSKSSRKGRARTSNLRKSVLFADSVGAELELACGPHYSPPASGPMPRGSPAREGSLRIDFSDADATDNDEPPHLPRPSPHVTAESTRPGSPLASSPNHVMGPPPTTPLAKLGMFFYPTKPAFPLLTNQPFNTDTPRADTMSQKDDKSHESDSAEEVYESPSHSRNERASPYDVECEILDTDEADDSEDEALRSASSSEAEPEAGTSSTALVVATAPLPQTSNRRSFGGLFSAAAGIIRRISGTDVAPRVVTDSEKQDSPYSGHEHDEHKFQNEHLLPRSETIVESNDGGTDEGADCSPYENERNDLVSRASSRLSTAEHTSPRSASPRLSRSPNDRYVDNGDSRLADSSVIEELDISESSSGTPQKRPVQRQSLIGRAFSAVFGPRQQASEEAPESQSISMTHKHGSPRDFGIASPKDNMNNDQSCDCNDDPREAASAMYRDINVSQTYSGEQTDGSSSEETRSQESIGETPYDQKSEAYSESQNPLQRPCDRCHATPNGECATLCDCEPSSTDSQENDGNTPPPLLESCEDITSNKAVLSARFDHWTRNELRLYINGRGRSAGRSLSWAELVAMAEECSAEGTPSEHEVTADLNEGEEHEANHVQDEQLLIDELSKLTVLELRRKLGKANADTKGRKKDLVERLEALMTTKDSESEEETERSMPLPTGNGEDCDTAEIVDTLSKLTVVELRQKLAQAHADTTGRKADLVARLQALPLKKPQESTEASIQNEDAAAHVVESQEESKEDSESQYASLTVAKLRKLVQKRGLDGKGRKQELIERLVESDRSGDIEAEPTTAAAPETSPRQHEMEDATSTPEVAEDAIVESEIQSMKMVDLRRELKKVQLSTSGTKAELARRLLDAKRAAAAHAAPSSLRRATQTPVAAPAAEEAEETDVTKLTVASIRVLLGERGLCRVGTKKQLVERVRHADASGRTRRRRAGQDDATACTNCLAGQGCKIRA